MTLVRLRLAAWRPKFVFRFLQQRKAIILRLFLCWAIGVAALIFDEVHNYDLRFELRPPQKYNEKIILILMTESDLKPELNSTSPNLYWDWNPQKIENDEVTWNEEVWDTALGFVLTGNPRGVGITLHFAETAPGLAQPVGANSPIQDPRVFWSLQLRGDDRPVVPHFIDQNRQLISHVGLPVDSDGMVRRFFESHPAVKHLTAQLAEVGERGFASRYAPHENEVRLINYRGPEGTFKHLLFSKLIRGEYSPALFKDKIVIFGMAGDARHFLRTPVGLMSRAEVTANIVDNFTGNHWIERMGRSGALICLLLILLVSAGIIFSYPQSVAFVFLLWFSTGLAALSLWLFDSMYFWMPILSPLVQIGFTYVVLLSHLVGQKENRAWRLEQEQRYFKQIEELKTNFVSLISHDLKTPIAKIQAIIDRQLTKTAQPDLIEDFKSIRRESQELHRYIDSILRMTQVESNEIKIHRDSLDLNLLIEKTVANLSPLAQAKAIKLNCSLEPLFLVEADSVLMREVILNLIENAIKYSPPESIISIQSSEVDGNILFEVVDEGPGIPKDEQPLVFNKFYRGRATNMTQKGSGLGLYLVKYFIDLHGGSVFLDSQVGKGTRVGFQLPITNPQEDLFSKEVSL